MKPVSALVALAVLAAPLAAQQRDTATTLPEIVITATRVPTPTSDLATRVTVLTGKDLLRAGYTSLADALRATPSLDVVDESAFGSQTSVFMRGGESDYVKVLVDGVPVNEPGGAYDFANLSLDDVRRVEIVRGPGSVLYGSDAVAGVIQIFTRSGLREETSSVGAAVRGGTYGSTDARVSGVMRAGNLGFSGAVHRFSDDGLYAFNNQYRNTTAAGHLTWLADPRTRVELTAHYDDANYHYPTDASGAVVDHNAFQTSRVTTLGANVTRWLSRSVESQLLLSLNHIGGGIDDAQDGPADTLGFYGYQSDRLITRRSAEGRVNVHLGTSVLTAGAVLQGEHEWTTSASQSQYGNSADTSDATRVNRAAYLQVLAHAGPLAVNAGARVDDNGEFGTFETYRGGVSLPLRSGTRLYASVGTGFKEPTFFENFGGAFVIGNTGLKPERSFSWEGGVEQALVRGRLSLSATYFDQHFRDLIQYTATPPTPTSPNYFNIAGADARGLELEVNAHPSAAWSVTANYTRLWTEVTDAGFASDGSDPAFVTGAELLRRPAHAGAVTVGFNGVTRLHLQSQLEVVGARADANYTVYPATRVTLPAYALVHVGGTLDLLRGAAAASRVAVTFRVENLLAHRYEQIFHFPARGRTVLVGMRIGE